MSKVTIVVHSGDLDKIMSALIIGNGYLSMGDSCTLFFTFWGLRALRKGKLKKSRLGLSRMNMAGLGAWMMKKKMKKANVAAPYRLMEDFKALGGIVLACEMTMGVMGISKRDLDHHLIDDYVGVGQFVKASKESSNTLFI